MDNMRSDARAWVLALALYLGGAAYAQGQAFVAYEVTGPGDPAPTDLEIQRLSLDGAVGWPTGAAAQVVAQGAERELAPAACPDGSGGAIVVYTQEFTTGERQGDSDVVAQRFDSAGRPVWNGGAEPVRIAASPQLESRPVVLSDGSGGAFVVFEWTGPDGDTDLLGQRISAQGNLLWSRGQPVPLAASEYPEHSAVLVPDGEGGFFVVCQWDGPERDSDIMAQRVTRRGQLLWNYGQQAVDVAASGHAERNPTAVANFAGELLVFFELEYLSGDRTGNVDVAGQRISGYGEALWALGDPIMVGATDAWEGGPQAVSDGAGGAVVVFASRPMGAPEDADTNLLAQRLAPSGRPVWGEGSPVALDAAPERAGRALGLATGDGGAIWVYELVTGAGDANIVAQRLDGSGQPVWNGGQGPLAVANTLWAERLEQVVPDGAGGAMVLLTATSIEEATRGDTDVRAVRLAADGTLPWPQPAVVAGGPGLRGHPFLTLVSN